VAYVVSASAGIQWQCHAPGWQAFLLDFATDLSNRHLKIMSSALFQTISFHEQCCVG
jgi:hypothetical protein